MYSIDANEFMNAVMCGILGTAALLLVFTLAYVVISGKTRGPVLSYLYMLTALFSVFSVAVFVLGFRGQQQRRTAVALLPRYEVSAEIHIAGTEPVLRRWSQQPPAAGEHDPLRWDRLLRRRRPSRPSQPRLPESGPSLLLRHRQSGSQDADKDGVEMLNKPVWQDGKLVGEGYYVNHVPESAIVRAGGWEALLKRGHEQFDIHCAVCHGTSGRGGGGDAAFGIVGRRDSPSRRPTSSSPRSRPSRTVSSSTPSRAACAPCRPTRTR